MQRLGLCALRLGNSSLHMKAGAMPDPARSSHFWLKSLTAAPLPAVPRAYELLKRQKEEEDARREEEEALLDLLRAEVASRFVVYAHCIDPQRLFWK